MATLNFPDDPTTGDIYTDSNSGFTYEWNGTVWISQDPSTAANIREIDNISSDFQAKYLYSVNILGEKIKKSSKNQIVFDIYSNGSVVKSFNR